jgi:hypothetical protein
MSQERKERLERCIEIALENRKLEIDLVWKRTAVFWVFVAAIFLAVIAAAEHRWSGLSIALSLTGVVFSLIWTLVNRGSRSWQESWELKAEHFLEARYGPTGLLGGRWERGGPRFLTLHSGFFTLRPRHYSVSGLLVALSDFVLIFWICLVVYMAQSALPPLLHDHLARLGAVDKTRLLMIGTLVYCAYVLIWCRSRSDPRDMKIER